MFLPRTFNSCLLRNSRSITNSFSFENKVFEGKRNSSTLPPVLADVFQYASSCNLTTSLQFFIEEIHSTTGLGWGLSFVASAFLLRAVTSPAHVYAEKLFSNNFHLTNYIRRKCIDDISQEFKIKTKFDKSGTQLILATDSPRIIAAAEKMIKKTTLRMIYKNKLFPHRILALKTTTIPVWMCSSFAIRNIISDGFSPVMPGILWINDLMLPDPYFILPVTVGLIGFLNVYSRKLSFPDQKNTQTRVYDFCLAFMTLVAVRAMMDLPACISLYWLSVSVSGILESTIIRYPKVKKLLGIKKLPTDSVYPIVNLFSRRKLKN